MRIVVLDFCVDSEGPNLTCPALVANTSMGVNFALVNFSAAISVSDNADPNVDVVCSRSSPDNFTLGVSYVNCTATDHVNLTDSCNFSVTVLGESKHVWRVTYRLIHMYDWACGCTPL